MKKDTAVFIRHMWDAIVNINEFMRDHTEKSFMQDKLVQSAVVRQIEVIGEAAKNIPSEFRKAHSDIPWLQIVGMRDKLIHHYFGVDLITVWKVVREDLPELKAKLREMLEQN